MRKGIVMSTFKVDWNGISKTILDVFEGRIADLTLTLITEILGMQDEQMRLLKSIQHDVTALLQGPYNTGILYLQEATQNVTKKERNSSIQEAKNCFMHALGQDAEVPFRKALIEYYIGICTLLLGNQEQAKNKFESSYATAVYALVEKKKAIGKRSILNWLLLFGGIFVLLIGLVLITSKGIIGILFIIAAVLMIMAPGHFKKKNFKKQCLPIIEFMDSLEYLHIQSPALELRLAVIPPELYKGRLNMRLLRPSYSNKNGVNSTSASPNGVIQTSNVKR